ncbi:MAG: Na(+)/dicarboxylate symporter [Candidatus Accumulibacter appositus]|uniref:Na(+)/dicarboxylate symporter n=1 Tax=Candidatus Accumulibacter appositus TaxID=1454003 RepID=A0A011NFY5_9PROT|nr:SLC13 family permease [Accumulibacter sp.]EXI81588.1 MAG: Na(+)/dicarboxylate symporter [Candidatus Accumulibacter appositus]HRF06848.1 SLC13 family permease [Accumulibacter sp.]
MTGDILLVFGLLLATILLFVSDRLRMDIVAVLAVLALMLSGLLAPSEALAGFGDPLVVLIAGLFVIGEGLFRTGVAFAIGNWLLGVAGSSETRLLVLLMLVVAGLSAFMSNTGAVAVFIPVALNLSTKAGVPASRLLMPMAFAGSLGGMLTLIGTPPNLVVSNQLSREGLQAFNFFSFTPLGVLILVATIAFIVLLGRFLLPKDGGPGGDAPNRLSLDDLISAYAVKDQLFRLHIEPGSPLVGQKLGQAQLRSRYEVIVVGLERQSRGNPVLRPALLETEYRADDIIYLVATEQQVDELLRAGEGLLRLSIETAQERILAQELGLAEVLLTPRSRLVGRTIKEARFRERYGLSVLGILRLGQPIKGDFLATRLDFGDSLLVGGGWRQIDLLQAEQGDFLVLTIPREMDEVAPQRQRAPWALAIVAGMLALMTFNIVPSVTAVLLAALAMVLARCVSMEEAYKSINWQSIILIAGMLPMATALNKTGALELIVNGLVSSLGEFGPLALMAGLFVLTSLFSQFISNTATAVLVAPIAMGAATSMQLSPYPFLMTVALAASTAFSTPMASPVNTLVLGPGGYRFNDFVKMGVPLQLLAMLLTLLAVPLLFPLR